MGGLIPVDRLHHVNVVVRDLKATARNYALIFGVERWDVAHLGAERLTDTSAFGYEAPYTYSTATGANSHGVTFRLVQPTGGLSTFAEFLITRGEGIHGLCLSVVDERELQGLRLRLRENGVGVGQSATVDGAARHCQLDTRGALGGFYLEVIAPTGSDWDPARGVDERWDFHDQVERPPGVGDLQEMPRVWHFAVAVGSVMEKLPAYASLLGLTDWTFVHFRPEPGSLERSTLNGEVVEYASLLAKADLEDFGFEILQSMAGPTHYKQEFIDRVGEGIHHLLVLPAQEEEASLRLRRWMASLDVPVAMSGRVRHGAAEFFYLDTRQRLGGYLVEAICRYAPASGQQPAGSRPDYRFDFSRKASF
jgi:catechol 2,3-dioxygenase-like lactoylglutathione lyase family enzyme